MTDQADPSRRPAEIVSEYSNRRASYEDFTRACERLLISLVDAAGIRVHSITSRAKSIPALEEKIRRTPEEYSALADITDLCGIRIITYFSDDVDRLGTVVEQEFDIDRQNSVDKRQTLDPDRFGYISLHYVCRLSAERLRLAEYRRFESYVCEIQVRTILQHAWAEIEHDLGYKSAVATPRHIRRRFSRLAGLLETADDEFMGIRDDLQRYAHQVRAMLAANPEDLLIDNVSLGAFIAGDNRARRLDEEMARWSGWELQERGDLTGLVAELQYVKVNTIADLGRAIERYGSLTVRQFNERIHAKSGPRGHSVNRGIGLFHLFQVLAAEGGVDGLMKAFAKFRIGSPRRSARTRAEEIVNAIEKAKSRPDSGAT